jgi:hypothetical protein
MLDDTSEKANKIPRAKGTDFHFMLSTAIVFCSVW